MRLKDTVYFTECMLPILNVEFLNINLHLSQQTFPHYGNVEATQCLLFPWPLQVFITSSLMENISEKIRDIASSYNQYASTENSVYCI